FRPKFYFMSCPAHSRLHVRRIGRHDDQPETIGYAAPASRRRLSKYIQFFRLRGRCTAAREADRIRSYGEWPVRIKPSAIRTPWNYNC
ncbi:MAG: hypothetical protein ACRD8O_19445, partial [Bryobacteraceae bacterium]